MTDPFVPEPRSACAICGTPQRADDACCPVCGARSTPPAIVPAPTAPPAVPPPVLTGPDVGLHATAVPAPRRSRLESVWSRRWFRRAVGIAALAVAVTPVAVDDLRVRSRLTSTRDQLHTTEMALTRTRSDLEGTRRELRTTRADLETRTRERDGLRNQLDATNAELAGVRGSLSEAQSRLNLQAGQIATLKSCLSGVVQALVYVADGYYGLAVSALEAVDVACRQAAELF